MGRDWRRVEKLWAWAKSQKPKAKFSNIFALPPGRSGPLATGPVAFCIISCFVRYCKRKMSSKGRGKIFRSTSELLPWPVIRSNPAIGVAIGQIAFHKLSSRCRSCQVPRSSFVDKLGRDQTKLQDCFRIADDSRTVSRSAVCGHPVKCSQVQSDFEGRSKTWAVT